MAFMCLELGDDVSGLPLLEQRLTTLIEHLPFLEQGQRRSHKALAILGTIHVPTGGHNLLMPPTISLCPKLIISNVGECSISVLTVLGTFPVSGLWSSKKREKGKRKKTRVYQMECHFCLGQRYGWWWIGTCQHQLILAWPTSVAPKERAVAEN